VKIVRGSFLATVPGRFIFAEYDVSQGELGILYMKLESVGQEFITACITDPLDVEASGFVDWTDAMDSATIHRTAMVTNFEKGVATHVDKFGYYVLWEPDDVQKLQTLLSTLSK
jgi:hypothetical protein